MASTTSTIDTSESKASFSVKKLGFLTVKGTITDFQGNIVFDENDLENSNFDVSISAITIDTGNAKRDEHLKSKDFFFVKDFPQIRFRSSAIRKEKDQFLAIGELTLLKKTNEIAISFTFQNGILKGSFSLNRYNYELGTKFPTFIVGKTVQIAINSKIK